MKKKKLRKRIRRLEQENQRLHDDIVVLISEDKDAISVTKARYLLNKRFDDALWDGNIVGGINVKYKHPFNINYL